MTSDFVVDRRGGSSSEAAPHALADFQFVKHRLDAPTSMIKSGLDNIAPCVVARQLRPFRMRDFLRIENVGDDRRLAEAGNLIFEDAQRDFAGQRFSRDEPFAGRFAAGTPNHQAIARTKPFHCFQRNLASQTDAKKRLLLSDLVEQRKAPTAC